jgi:hypothetical protein
MAEVIYAAVALSVLMPPLIREWRRSVWMDRHGL